MVLKCAMIGLGMVSVTYAQAILNSADITGDPHLGFDAVVDGTR